MLTGIVARLQRSRVIRLLFDVSAIVKGVDGVLEIVGGAVLLFIRPSQLDAVVRLLTQHELSRDPQDLVANLLLNGTRHLTAGTQAFAAVYLLWHGAIKVVLVTALLLEKRWAYPAAIGAFTLFLVYQLYRYSHTFAPLLLALSVMDVAVIGLTWLEYRRLRARPRAARSRLT